MHGQDTQRPMEKLDPKEFHPGYHQNAATNVQLSVQETGQLAPGEHVQPVEAG